MTGARCGTRCRRRRWPPSLFAILCLGVVGPAATLALAQAAAHEDTADAAAADVHVVVEPEHRFALRLPASHDLSRSGTQWYVHGFLNGEPLVPDLTVAFQPEIAAREVVARDFAPGTAVREVELGPGTRGLLVDAEYEAVDGTPYRSTTYLVEGPAGTYRIDRYEAFEWRPFDVVARSFHFVTFADDPPRSARRPSASPR